MDNIPVIPNVLSIVWLPFGHLREQTASTDIWPDPKRHKLYSGWRDLGRNYFPRYYNILRLIRSTSRMVMASQMASVAGGSYHFTQNQRSRCKSMQVGEGEVLFHFSPSPKHPRPRVSAASLKEYALES